ncbi:MAG: hypothetical protein OT477_12040, partial [Chloroflexi bacterium]|nr:hypothetical protein [Chloroflexota bacterium]
MRVHLPVSPSRFGRLGSLVVIYLALIALVWLNWPASSAVASAAMPVNQLFHPVVHKEFAGNHTTITIQNITSASTTAYAHFYPLFGGTPLYVEEVNLPPFSTYVVDSGVITELPNNTYSVLITNELGISLSSVATTLDNLGHAGTYRGIDQSQIASNLFIGPLLKQGFDNSVIVQNTTALPNTIDLTFTGSDGVVVYTQTLNLNPYQQFLFHINSNINIPPAFTGHVSIIAQQGPIVGLLKLTDSSTGEVTYKGRMEEAFSVSYGYFPRIANNYDRDTFYTYTTKLVLINTDTASALVDVHYSDDAGDVLIDSIPIVAQGMVITTPPVGIDDSTYYGGRFLASQPIYFTDLHTADAQPNRTYLSYESPRALVHGLPTLHKTDGLFSLIHLQHIDATIPNPELVNLDFYDLSGNFILSTTVTLFDFGARDTIDLRDLPLPNNYTGQAVVTAVSAQIGVVVDTMQQPLPTCYATADGGQTVYNDVQDAIFEASSLGTNEVRVAGYCYGTDLWDDVELSHIYINSPMTVRGGYRPNNWQESDPVLFPTILDAEASGYVVQIDSPANHVILENLVLINGAATNGAGIWANLPSGQLTLQNIKLINNVATNQGGGLYIETGTTVSATQLLLDNNEAVMLGGGIAHRGTAMWLSRSAVINNGAGTGGGGGIHSISVLTLTNSTLSGNQGVGSDGGGIAFGGGGVGYLSNNTIAQNTAAGSGGIESGGGTIYLYNNIIAGNNASSNADCGGTFQSQGYNIIQSIEGCTITGDSTGNIIGDPGLEPLQNNGGRTLTHAL